MIYSPNRTVKMIVSGPNILINVPFLLPPEKQKANTSGLRNI